MIQRFALLLALVGLAFLSSCTLKQEFHFNEDLSGKVRYSMDLSAFYQFMNTLPDEASGSEEFSFEDSVSTVFVQAAQVLEGIPGITGVTHGSDDLGPYLEYDFRDLDALNATMSSGLPTSGSQEHEFFAFKRRKLTFSPDLKALEEMNSEEFASMGEMFQYQMHFYFDPGLLRDVDGPMAEVSADMSKISMEMSLNQMHQSGDDLVVSFKGKFKP